MESITKLLDKNLSQLRYPRGKKHWLSYRWVQSWPPFPLLFGEKFLAIFVSFAQFVTLHMAFFTFLLYKSELLLIVTLFVVVAMKIIVTFAIFVDH